MQSIWQIDGNNVVSLQGQSADFVRLINALIAIEGRTAGLRDTTQPEGDGAGRWNGCGRRATDPSWARFDRAVRRANLLANEGRADREYETQKGKAKDATGRSAGGD